MCDPNSWLVCACRDERLETLSGEFRDPEGVSPQRTRPRGVRRQHNVPEEYLWLIIQTCPLQV